MSRCQVQASSRESRAEPDEKALNQAAEEPKKGFSTAFRRSYQLETGGLRLSCRTMGVVDYRLGGCMFRCRLDTMSAAL